MNLEVLNEIKYVIGEFAKSENSVVMIITGSGEKASVAGADIKAQHFLNPEEGRQWALLGHEVFRLIETVAANAPTAVRYAKIQINQGLQTDINTAITV